MAALKKELKKELKTEMKRKSEKGSDDEDDVHHHSKIFDQSRNLLREKQLQDFFFVRCNFKLLSLNFLRCMAGCLLLVSVVSRT